MSKSIPGPDSMPTETRITCESYDAAASAYAWLSDDYGSFPGLKAQLLSFESKALPNGSLLDLGCGGGRDSRTLARQGRQVVALDYSFPMLMCAAGRSTEADRRHILFTQGNMLALPFVEDQFSGVWASASLLHLPLASMSRALSEVLRVLRPGGTAAIGMKAGNFAGWREGGSLPGRRWFTFVDCEPFSQIMTDVGCRDIEVKFSGRDGWFVAIGRK